MPRSALALVLLLGCDELTDSSAREVILGQLAGSYELVELEVYAGDQTIVGTSQDVTMSFPAFGAVPVRVEGGLDVVDGRMRFRRSWVVDGHRGLDPTIEVGGVDILDRRLVFHSATQRVVRIYEIDWQAPDLLELRLTPPMGCRSATSPERRWRFRRVEGDRSHGFATALVRGSEGPTGSLMAEVRESATSESWIASAVDPMSQLSLSLVLAERPGAGELQLEGADPDGDDPAHIAFSDLYVEAVDSRQFSGAILGFVDRNGVVNFRVARHARMVVSVENEAELRFSLENVVVDTPVTFMGGRVSIDRAEFRIGLGVAEDVDTSCQDPRAEQITGNLVAGVLIGANFAPQSTFLTPSGDGFVLTMRSGDTPCGVEEEYVGSRRLRIELPSDALADYRIGIDAQGTMRANLDSVAAIRELEHGIVRLDAMVAGGVRGRLSVRAGDSWAEGTFTAPVCAAP